MIRMIDFSLIRILARQNRARWLLRVCANSREEYGLLSLMELCLGCEPGFRAGVILEKRSGWAR